ncbi:MAG TPA: hypothetical protein VFX18_01960 [Candidatus Nitrosocosmicus sp.]|nr:hypothetical protein [Candidatus Nitrosocosmicus sp.]
MTIEIEDDTGLISEEHLNIIKDSAGREIRLTDNEFEELFYKMVDKLGFKKQEGTTILKFRRDTGQYTMTNIPHEYTSLYTKPTETLTKEDKDKPHTHAHAHAHTYPATLKTDIQFIKSKTIDMQNELNKYSGTIEWTEYNKKHLEKLIKMVKAL